MDTNQTDYMSLRIELVVINAEFILLAIQNLDLQMVSLILRLMVMTWQSIYGTQEQKLLIIVKM